MSVLYLHFRKGEPIDKAMRMLSLRYGHVRQGKTGIIDTFFELYLAQGAPKGLSLIEWMERDYDPVKLKDAFRSSWFGNVVVDKILRRE